MEYILHIGMPKTGSTSLQNALFNNHEVLREFGIVFPNIGLNRTECGQVRHEHLISALQNYNTNKSIFKDWDDFLHRETDNMDICVISYENMFPGVCPQKLLPLFPRDRTRIVVYIREQAEYIASLYANQIRWDTLQETFAEYSQIRPRNYFRVMNRWREVYGQENLTFRLYSRESLLGGNIIDDFANLVRPGLQNMLDTLKYDLHPSISGNLLFTKFILNKFITAEESNSIVSELTKLTHLDPNFRGRFYVDLETVTRIANRCREHCEALEKHFGVHLETRSEPIEGSACPDHDNFVHDYRRIYNYALETGGHLGKLLKIHNDEILRLAPVLNPMA